MIGFLLPLLGVGIPAWMKPWMKWAIDIALAVALLAGLWGLHGLAEHRAYNRAYNDGWNALAKMDAAAVAKSQATNAKAVATADTERATDTKAIQTDKDERDAAIKNAPASSTGNATRAANCVRWKRTHPTEQAPAACR